MMNNYNRKEQLEKLHKERKQATEEKVLSAIDILLNNNKPINFNSVAKSSGVTKATLYKNSNIKDIIENLRNSSNLESSPLYNINNDSSEKLLLEIKKLDAENKKLKELVNALYSYIYEIL